MKIHRKLKPMCRHNEVIAVEYGGIEPEPFGGVNTWDVGYLLCMKCMRKVTQHSAPRVMSFEEWRESKKEIAL